MVTRFTDVDMCHQALMCQILVIYGTYDYARKDNRVFFLLIYVFEVQKSYAADDQQQCVEVFKNPMQRIIIM